MSTKSGDSLRLKRISRAALRVLSDFKHSIICWICALYAVVVVVVDDDNGIDKAHRR